jgi:hypothetical protein
MVFHCVWQHLLDVPHWADFEARIIEANFDMKYILAITVSYCPETRC